MAPLLTNSFREGGVPLRERLREVIRVLGVWSKEPLRELFEETDELSSSLNWNLVFIRWMASAFGSLKLSVRGGGGGSSLKAGARLDFGDTSSAS